MLREVGLEPPSHPPQLLTPAMMEGAAVCVTMGCLDHASCPAGLRERAPEDWGLADPAKLDDAGFRRVRDEIVSRVADLCGRLTSGNLPDPRPAARP